MKNLEVHGVYSIYNTGGIEVHIVEGYDPFVYWRYSIIDTPPQKWHKAKINYAASGRAYFRAQSMRIYLDHVMRILRK